MRSSRRVRIRLDLTVRFDRDLKEVPPGLVSAMRPMLDAMEDTLRKLNLEGADEILPGARFLFNLDERREKEPGLRKC
jgi:hypothetical protein